ncbi:hypothetical protein NNJEOMEG_02201 [Fundidesulfovibrio magnetotacticus]|uniref:DUF4160 domain-containing protein n=1 Tax=Fundidesulfovibrio magnetotacticus TaxID=2730080 RepID=A0A6V8LXI1_9BACT|nr:DUF4160 domain-containing protein [Fundidesulfovibrio magnetotacticus]GFK94357.1 hypothetical protein NNJEOMEG_02201 [Fundidesulfovibrio magnetotacticus]
MVTVRRFGKARITILTGDHLPPHFHVDTPEGELCVDLTSGEVKGDKTARRSGKVALEWAAENRDSLFTIWQELNP